MEHYPSFHTYCKRQRSSPTGKTPVQIEKRRQLEFPDQNRSYKKWSKEEKLAMMEFVTEHGLPSANVNKFWEECARYIFQTTGLVKSGASCKSQHARVKCLFPSACLATDESTTICDVSNSSRKNEASTQYDHIYTCTVSTQTDPVLPVLDIRETEREWSYISVRDKLPKSKNEVETLAMKLSNTRLSSFDDVTLSDRATLLHAALYTSTETIAETVLNSESLRKAVKMLLIWEVEQKASSKCIRDESSILYPNRDLTAFSWNDICTELFQINPLLAEVLLAVALPTGKLGMIEPIRSLLPKLGLVYSILMSNRFVELSLVQKIIAITMKNEQTHEKVFDRLQILGVSSSYEATIREVDKLANSCFKELQLAVREGRVFRIVGDNVNFRTGVRHERENYHGGTKHWFASAAIVQHMNFANLPDQPQGSIQDLALDQLSPSQRDQRRLKSNYTTLILNAAVYYLPFLKKFQDFYCSEIEGEFSEELANKSVIVPLPVLPYNEQQYSDVCKIMQSYNETIYEIYGCTNHPPVHIGGDQLTRERFSGAKGLHQGAFDARERLRDLYPITFELWHTAMNFLTMAYQKLFSLDGFETGSMNGERIHIRRHDVNADVKNHYDVDKDFFLSFVKSYIVEALCDFFGLCDLNSTPTKNIPPDPMTDLWLHQTMDHFIEIYVLSGHKIHTIVEETVKDSLIPITVKVSDVEVKTIYILKQGKKTVSKPKDTDHVQQYGHTVLQVGLLYMEFLDVIHRPDRDRLLGCLKYMMLMFKSHNSRSKYAFEILRLLCHQQASYSLRTAYQSIYGLFVNIRGKKDSHIPADLAMEHLVKRTKKMLKGLGPMNKDKNLLARSKAVAVMDNIADNFDSISDVKVRAGYHKERNSHTDELKMIYDLREVKPFVPHSGRCFSAHKNILAPADSVNELEFESWIDYHKVRLEFESGK